MSNDDKCHLIEKSTHVINEIDHRMPVYWPCLTSLCQAIAPSIPDLTLSNLINQVCNHENVSNIMNISLVVSSNVRQI